MRTLEYKFARLEEQNAALRLKLRHYENEISRLSVRESQLKDARRLPLLQKRLDAEVAAHEDLECQLAEARVREAKLSEEVSLLRTFVRLSENPQLAAVAEDCVSRERREEDHRALGEQLRLLATERDEFRKRALLSCEEAERYREELSAVLEEKKRLEEYMKKLIAAQPSVNESASLNKSGCAGDLQEMRRNLNEERARSEALHETIEALYEEKKEMRRAQSRSQRLSSSVSIEHVSGKDENVATGSTETLESLRQQLRFSEGECALVTRRWNSVREQNKSLLARVLELERNEATARGQLQHAIGEYSRLRREVELVSHVNSFLTPPQNLDVQTKENKVEQR